MSAENIGELIDGEYIALEKTATVGETIEEIRSHTPNHETTVYYVYVLGSDNHLFGVVSMRELLNETDETLLSEIALTDVVTVDSDNSPEEVMKTFAKHQFDVLPVVDSDGVFQGIIRARELIDNLDEGTTKKILRDSQSFGQFGD